MTDRCRIIVGDSRTALAALPEKSVRCCVTSPPGVGVELNPEYAKLAQKRIDETCPLLAHVNGPSLGGAK